MPKQIAQQIGPLQKPSLGSQTVQTERPNSQNSKLLRWK